jgi:hypothetical protein
MNLWTCNNTYLRTPLGIFTYLSVSKRVIKLVLTHLDWDFEKLNMIVSSH